jgi:hypothetical protein
MAHPVRCNLVTMVGGNYRMEVGKGLVYAHQALLDDVQMDSMTYVVVKVDMVYENAKNMKLEVPPNDMMLALWDAITKRVRWMKSAIDVNPSTIASASSSMDEDYY